MTRLPKGQGGEVGAQGHPVGCGPGRPLAEKAIVETWLAPVRGGVAGAASAGPSAWLIAQRCPLIPLGWELESDVGHVVPPLQIRSWRSHRGQVSLLQTHPEAEKGRRGGWGLRADHPPPIRLRQVAGPLSWL